MRRPLPWIAFLAVLSYGAASESSAPTVDDSALVSEEASGTLPSQGRTRLSISGVTGELQLRLGRPGEIRYLASAPRTQAVSPAEAPASKRGAPTGAATPSKTVEVPIELRATAGEFRLRPKEGGIFPKKLEVAVPPDVAVEVRASESRIVVSGLRGGLDVVGGQLVIDARAMEGSVAFDLHGGKLVLQGLQGDLSIAGEEIEAQVGSVARRVRLRSSGSRMKVEKAADFDADLAMSELEVAGVTGEFRLRAQGGSAVARQLAAGGTFLLTGAPLQISASRGELDIETDAAVTVSELDAELHVNGYGGTLKGSGIRGLLEVRTNAAEIDLQRVVGETRVQGENLKVRLQAVEGDLYVATTSSEVTIESPTGPVTVLNDYGDVNVRGAVQKVEIQNRSGSVRLHDQKGPVAVDAEGDLVELVWGANASPGESRVRNGRGDVRMHVLPQTGLSVEATSASGRIETTVRSMKVSEDGRSAEGVLGLRPQGKIRIEAEGNVHLTAKSVPAGPTGADK